MTAADVDALRARLSEAGLRWTTARQQRTAELAEARQRIHAAHASHAELVAELSALAREATAAGIGENECASLLGVSRARTLRRWLGK